MTKIGKKLAAVLLTVAMIVTFVPVVGTQTAYADGDTEVPQIDTSSARMEVLGKEGTTAEPGDTVRVSIDVTDESTLTRCSLRFKKPITGGEAFPKGNGKRIDGTNTWYWDLDITDDMEYGDWEVKCINLVDSFDNYVWYHNEVHAPVAVPNDHYINADLSGFSFKVTGTHPDTTPPVMDTETATVTPASAAPGDKVTFSMKVTDDKAVELVDIWVRQPNGHVDSWQTMVYNESTERYEYRISITEDSLNGEWSFYMFRAEDQSGNYSEIDYDELGEESPFKFTVTGASSEANPPVIDISSIRVALPEGNDSFASGDTVETSFKITDDTKVRWVDFWYVLPQTGMTRQIRGEYDADTDAWYSRIRLVNGSPTGTWKLLYISALDIYDNETKLYNSNVSDKAGAVDLSAADFVVKRTIGRATFDFPDNIVYNGSAYTPKPEASITIDGVTEPLEEGRDYQILSYDKNVNAGDATVSIMGLGDYAGTIERTFTIVPKQITPTVSLSKSAYTYNGKTQKPTVTVKDGSKKLVSGKDYTVTNSGRKSVGKGTVKVTLKGNYSGSKTVTYKINPKGKSIKSVTAGSKAITVKWKKQSSKMSTSRITGYQIQLATDSKFTKNKKTVTVKGYSKTSKKVTGLKGGKKYYVKIRTYKTVGGTNYYSPWSKVKMVTTKK